MSVLMSVVASPSASPVFQTTTTVVQQVTPENVRQFLSLLLLLATGWGASFAHGLLAPSKWHKLNVLVLFGYSGLLAVVDLFLQGKLKANNLIELGYAFLAILAAASIRYNATKLADPKPVVVEPVPAAF